MIRYAGSHFGSAELQIAIMVEKIERAEYEIRNADN